MQKKSRSRGAKQGISIEMAGQKLSGLTQVQASAVLNRDWLKCHGSIQKANGETITVNSPGIHIDVAASKVMYFDDNGRCVRRRPLADAAVEAMALVEQIQGLGISIQSQTVRAADSGQ